MQGVTVLIKDVQQQYEGLRTSLGLLLHATDVSMVVWDNQVDNMDEAYADNMEFLDEMEGRRYSNNQTNIEKHGFQPLDQQGLGELINASSLVIPF